MPTKHPHLNSEHAGEMFDWTRSTKSLSDKESQGYNNNVKTAPLFKEFKVALCKISIQLSVKPDKMPFNAELTWRILCKSAHNILLNTLWTLLTSLCNCVEVKNKKNKKSDMRPKSAIHIKTVFRICYKVSHRAGQEADTPVTDSSELVSVERILCDQR